MDVGVKELRDHLRHYLDAVQRGDELTVTERGRAVARILPASGRSTYERLVAEGKITPAARPRRPDDEHIHVTPRGSVSDILIEQRR
jgi:prevent-host-death family protein